MKDINEITQQLETGVKEVYESGKYKAYLDFMSKFYNYSLNNTILIFMQKPDASLVAGYKKWQELKRQVRKGEKGLTILAPCPHKMKKEVEDENGNKEVKEIKWNTYRAVSVFDISQTDGEEVPKLASELTDSVENFTELFDKLTSLSPVPVGFEEIKTGAKGYFSHDEKRIAIKEGMAEQQTIKTLIHEIGHAILHDRETGEEKEADKNTREVQAESIAYVVCSSLGLDTSDYSFGYVASWSGGKEVKELTASMEVIKKTSGQIIEALRAA